MICYSILGPFFPNEVSTRSPPQRVQMMCSGATRIQSFEYRIMTPLNVVSNQNHPASLLIYYTPHISAFGFVTLQRVFFCSERHPAEKQQFHVNLHWTDKASLTTEILLNETWKEDPQWRAVTGRYCLQAKKRREVSYLTFTNGCMGNDQLSHQLMYAVFRSADV